jgi:hypothetical protein
MNTNRIVDDGTASAKEHRLAEPDRSARTRSCSAAGTQLNGALPGMFGVAAHQSAAKAACALAAIRAGGESSWLGSLVPRYAQG